MANPENKQIPYESTQKDIRDAIESVATAIGGIAIPSADHVSYDNSVSGLSATDVQNALDEIASDIPTVNNGTLTIQQNGTSKGSFTANSAFNVNVNIETPTADKKTATTEFNTANGGLLSKCMIDLVPVQDLHGYDSPWAGGSRKNLLPIKDVNYSGNGITLKTIKDDAGNLIGFNINGTATQEMDIWEAIGDSIVSLASGVSRYCSIGLDTAITGLQMVLVPSFFGVQTSVVSAAEITGGYLNIKNGTTFNNVNIYPMICLDSESDKSFAPYSNICPISGHTEVDLQRDGANQWNETYFITGSKIKSYPIPVKENTEYRYINGSGYYASIDVVFSDGTYISFIGNIQNNRTFTTPLGCEYIAFTVTIDYGTTYKNDIAINYPSTITKYEPYLGHLYQVQIGSTVYGGYDEIVSGNGKSAYGIADFGDLTWYYDSANARFRGEMPSNYKQPTGASDRYQYLYCSCYKPDDSPVTGSHINNTIGGFQGTSYIWVNDSAYTDAGQFKTARTGQKIAYLLSTPTDITHDSTQIETLAGQNNLSTPLSGQSIETNGVEYKELFTFADVKSYVDKKIPDAPTTDGTYTLQAVVSGGVPTYSWV